MKKMFCFVLTLLFFLSPIGAEAAVNPPLDRVKGAMDKVIAVLQDDHYNTPELKAKQREEIWRFVKDIFDFRAISIRALARNWRQFSKEQQETFIAEFTQLLKNTYLTKLQGEYHNEKIVFVGEDRVSDKKSVVQTKILRNNIEIPMDYNMFFSKDEWWVYDVKIEGISLVKNYRTQFQKMLYNNSPDHVIESIREKNKEHETNKNGK